MRIVFMGTPDFAAASLAKLLEEKFDVVAVFTQPDKPKGRGMEMSFSPVKQLALEHDLPVYQPEKLRDGTALAMLQELQPDILVVVAYGKLLPNDLIIACNGITVRVVDDMTRLLSQMDPGDVVELTVIRKGVEMTVTVELYDRLSELQ